MTRTRLLTGAVALAAGLVLASCGWADTGEAQHIADYRADLHGSVANTVIGQTTFHFEYGLTTDYGQTTPTGSVQIADPQVAVPVVQTVRGLAEGTTYHYRLCATAADGNGSCGPDRTFTTTAGHDYVTGSGAVAVIFQLGLSISGNVDASSGADGVDPTGQAETYPGTRYFRLGDKGPVTCLRVEGNRATVGFLADPLGFGGPDDVPVPMVAFIEDNAATATPDRWGSRPVPEVLTSCPAATDADFVTPGYESFGGNVTQGDFVVHDHPAG